MQRMRWPTCEWVKVSVKKGSISKKGYTHEWVHVVVAVVVAKLMPTEPQVSELIK